MLRLLRDVAKLFLKPKQFAASSTLPVRQFMHRVFVWGRYGHYLKRRAKVKEIAAPALLPITEAQGFRRIDDLDPQVAAAALSYCRTLKNGINWDDQEAASTNKHLVSYSIKETDKGNPIMQLALNPAILKMVGDYLGMLPVIENIMIWYSPNKNNFQNSSQFYHLDAQDVRTLQIFFYLEDVHEDNGPLCLIEADATEKLALELKYRKSGGERRVSDEVAESFVGPEKVHRLLGPAGTAFIADTDRCFHYGSRKATKARFLLCIQYFTPFAFAVPTRWWTKLPYANISNLGQYTELEQWVLGAKPN